MKNSQDYNLIMIIVMLLVSITAKILSDWYNKKIEDKVGILMTFFTSLLGGLVAGSISRVYFDVLEYQWVAVAVGSWTGQKIIETIAEAYKDKFTPKKDDNENKN